MRNVTLYLTMILGAFLAMPRLVDGDEPVSTAAIKTAIEKGLPFVAEKGDWWIEKKECMSCHRVAFTAWSHIEAKYAGIDVDEDQVNEWVDWCIGNLFEPFPEKDQKYPGELTIERNLSGAAQMLALAKNWKSSDSQKKFHRKIVEKLKKGQQKNGRWNPKGQLPGQKRELEETSHVITLWNTLALISAADLEHIDASGIRPMAKNAKAYVDSFDKGKSSEWLALRALFARKMDDKTNEQKYLNKLLDKQNKDGGWGWIAGDESDVLATAQIVYALHEMDIDVTSKSVQRATGFLVAKQTEDGSWKVKGTKEKAKKRFTETANYWGSAWAVIALSRVHAERTVASRSDN